MNPNLYKILAIFGVGLITASLTYLCKASKPRDATWCHDKIYKIIQLLEEVESSKKKALLLTSFEKDINAEIDKIKFSSHSVSDSRARQMFKVVMDVMINIQMSKVMTANDFNIIRDLVDKAWSKTSETGSKRYTQSSLQLLGELKEGLEKLAKKTKKGAA